jgi:hypothetical protein
VRGVYYYNTVTGVSSWTKPVEASTVSTATPITTGIASTNKPAVTSSNGDSASSSIAGSGSAAADSGSAGSLDTWVKYESPQGAYYYNTRTGVSSWTNPTAAASQVDKDHIEASAGGAAKEGTKRTAADAAIGTADAAIGTADAVPTLISKKARVAPGDGSSAAPGDTSSAAPGDTSSEAPGDASSAAPGSS